MSRKRPSDGDAYAEEELKRMAMKHAGLKQDYHELQRVSFDLGSVVVLRLSRFVSGPNPGEETRAMKKRLQRAKLKKDVLLAEVRFLRRRHKFLLKNSLDSTVMEEVSPCKPMGAQAAGHGCDIATRETAHKEQVAPPGVMVQSPSTLDWGLTPEPKPLVAREFQVFWEPLRATGQEEVSTFVDAAGRKSLLESGGLASDLKLSIFKDIPNGFILPNRTAKRKISWQDQMALKV